MTDLYALLGVAKDAAADVLHMAFRKKAKEYHPDKGGDEAKFKEVAQAYAVLHDPVKRAAYDRDGTIDVAASNPHLDALRLVEAEVAGLLAAFSQQDQGALIHTDVISLITKAFDEKIVAIEQLAERMRRDVIKFSEFADRFTVEEGAVNIVRKMIETRIRNIEAAIPVAEADLIKHRAAREIIAGHSFRVEPVPMPKPVQFLQHTVSSNPSFARDFYSPFVR